MNWIQEQSFMRLIKRFLSSLDRVERIGFFLFVFSFFAAGIACLLYELFGPGLVESIYNGESLPFLNRLIQYQQTKSLDHYLINGQTLFFHILTVGMILWIALWGWCWFIYRLTLTEKKIHLLWVIALAVFTHHMVFVLNPSWRVYYSHGLFRGSLVYQILQGHAPPLDPLFAGGPVKSPWAFPWLAAQIVQFFEITPFRSFQLINSVCLGLCIWIVYRIAGLLTHNQKIRLFSSMITIFGITPFSDDLIFWIQHLFHVGPNRWRAIPVFVKFVDASGDPMGLVFVLLSLYAFLKLPHTTKQVKYSFLLSCAVLGCGFFFPAFFPGLVCGLIAAALAGILLRAKQCLYAPKYFLLLLLLLAIPCILLLPYIRQTSSGPRTETQFFNPPAFFSNLTRYLVPFLPILVLLWWNRKWLTSTLNTKVSFALLIFSGINLIAFLCINIPANAEYKFLVLSFVSLGIIAGTVFEYIRKKNPFVCLFLFLLFLLPFAIVMNKTIHRLGNQLFTNIFTDAPWVTEKGIFIESLDPEERELYQWIRTHASEEAVFVDTSWWIPIMAQRRLWMGLDRPNGSFYIGYSISMIQLKERNAYPDDRFFTRKNILENLYGLRTDIPENHLAEQIKQKNLWVVVRTEELKGLSGTFRAASLPLVFQSSRHHFSIYHADSNAISTPQRPTSPQDDDEMQGIKGAKTN